jgi:Zn-finger nucleic acid-binding protein
MKPVRSCPHCAHALQPFIASARSGTEIELERCSQCGGFWGERGRIQDSFGPAASYELVGGDTNRRCVLCRILMTPARLSVGAAVEVCSACRGMFLDANELEQIGGRDGAGGAARSGLPRPPASRPPPPRAARPPVTRAAPPVPAPAQAEPPVTRAAPPSLNSDWSLEIAEAPSEEVAQPESTAGTFECVECGKRKPLREGQALRDGLACRSCMKARAEGRDSEELGLRSLLRGRPKS